jgi:hypothetical protein
LYFAGRVEIAGVEGETLIVSKERTAASGGFNFYELDIAKEPVHQASQIKFIT